MPDDMPEVRDRRPGRNGEVIGHVTDVKPGPDGVHITATVRADAFPDDGAAYSLVEDPEPLNIPTPPPPHYRIERQARWGPQTWAATVVWGRVEDEARYAWSEAGARRKAARALARLHRTDQWSREAETVVVGAYAPYPTAANTRHLDDDPVATFGNRRVYRATEGIYVAADDGGWLPGWRPTPEGWSENPDDWAPGSPCGQCGSTDTHLDDDGLPTCRACGAHDADE